MNNTATLNLLLHLIYLISIGRTRIALLGSQICVSRENFRMQINADFHDFLVLFLISVYLH